LVPILGIIVCAFMIIALDIFTLASAGAWMILGLLIYFMYSRKHSNLNNNPE
jgi:APA family basic amino acid/polyamine antiporter